MSSQSISPMVSGGDDRMKLLLALASSTEKSMFPDVKAAPPATVSGGTRTPPCHQTNASAILAEGQNLVTPTNAETKCIKSPAAAASVRAPANTAPVPTRAPTKPANMGAPMAPLARPPTLPSSAMFQFQPTGRHMSHPKGLKMPPPFPKAAGGEKKNFPLRSSNHNYLTSAATIKMTRTVPTLAAIKPTLAFHKNDTRASCLGGGSSGEPSQLHSVCCWGKDPRSDVSIIVGSIVARDRMAIRRKCQVPLASASKSNGRRNPAKSLVVVPSKSLFRRAPRNEPYGFPLNLALLHQPQDEPDLKVLRLLAELGPDVLRMHDGRNGGGSLIIALRHHSTNLEIIKLLLSANPSCIQVSDRRGNRPLHVACFHGAPLEVIQELYQNDPSAIDQANMSGDTPWNIVQRNSRQSSSPVADFLYACTKRREGRIRKTTPPSNIYIHGRSSF